MKIERRFAEMATWNARVPLMKHSRQPIKSGVMLNMF